MDSSFLSHVVQSTLPVLKICMLGAVGAVLATADILDQQGRRTLSRLIYFVFTPCLTFSKLAPVLSAQHLVLWMPLAINMFVSVAVGLLLGVLLLLLLKPPAWFRRHTLVATALGNAGNLPLVLVAALMHQSGGALFAEQHVSEDLAIAYVAMGIWAATLTHFTVGTYLLKLPAWRAGAAAGSQDGTAAAAAGKLQDEQLPLFVKGAAAGDGAAASPVTSGAELEQQQQHQHVQPELSFCSHASAVPQGAGSGSGAADRPHCIELNAITRSSSAADKRSSDGSRASGSFMLAARHGTTAEAAAGSNCGYCGVMQAVPSCPELCGAQHCTVCGQHDALGMSQQQQRQLQQTLGAPPAMVFNIHAAAGAAALLPPLQNKQGCPLPQQQQVPTCVDHEQQHEERESLLGPVIKRQLSSSDIACWLSFQQQQQHKQQLPQVQQQQQAVHRSSSSSSSSAWRRTCSCSCWGQRCRWLVAAVVAFGRAVWSLTSPPMVSCVVAVMVGVLPAVRDQLFEPSGHLLILQSCIDMFGDCCIPSLMLMLGATLAKGPGRSCPPLRVVLGVTVARLLVLPVLGTGWLLLAHKTGWLAAPDSMFFLVMLIQNAVPTALNVHTLATLNANREEEVGALLFWQYLAACITVPAALMFYLWLLKTNVFSVAAA